MQRIIAVTRYCTVIWLLLTSSNPSFHLRSRDISNEEKDLICQQVLDKVKRSRENREVVSAVLYIESLITCVTLLQLEPFTEGFITAVF